VPGDQPAEQVHPGERFGHGGHQPAGHQPPAEDQQQPGEPGGVDAIGRGGAGQPHRQVERAQAQQVEG
jgi:hypothetical protein